MKDKYACQECNGDGRIEIHGPEGTYGQGCVKCGGSGKQKITIDLEEYNLLKKRIDELELALGIC